MLTSIFNAVRILTLILTGMLTNSYGLSQKTAVEKVLPVIQQFVDTSQQVNKEVKGYFKIKTTKPIVYHLIEDVDANDKPYRVFLNTAKIDSAIKKDITSNKQDYHLILKCRQLTEQRYSIEFFSIDWKMNKRTVVLFGGFTMRCSMNSAHIQIVDFEIEKKIVM